MRISVAFTTNLFIHLRRIRLKIADSIRNGKPFKVWDILIYVCLAVIIAVIFLVTFAPKSDFTGIKIIIGENVVCTHEFQNSKTEIADGYDGTIAVRKDGDKILIYAYFDDDKSDYNRIRIDTKNKVVSVDESTCSIKKDCVYTKSITDSSGVIICMPHALKILPLSSEYIPPTVG